MTFVGAAFPLPAVAGFATKFAEADELRTAQAFEVEFTTPFCEDVVHCHEVERSGVGAVAEGVHIFASSAFIAQAHSSFCSVEVSLCLTHEHHHHVGVSSVGSGCAVGGEVVELSHCITILEGGGGFDVERAANGVEQGAVVFSSERHVVGCGFGWAIFRILEEELNQFRTCTVTTPCLTAHTVH